MTKWHSRKELPKIIETGGSKPLLIQVRTRFGNTPYFSGRRHDSGDIHGWYIETPYNTVGEVVDKGVMRWAYMRDVLEAMDDARCATWEKTDDARCATWEKTEVDGWYACSQCGGDTDRRTNYCPCCGAAMGE